MKNGWLRASGERKWLRLIEFLIVFSRIGEMKKQPTKQTFSNNLLQSQTFETRCLFTRVVKASVNGSSCMQQQSFKWDFFFNRKSPGYIGEWIWTWTWWESFPFLHRIRANWRNLEMHFVKTWWNFGQCLFFLNLYCSWSCMCVPRGQQSVTSCPELDMKARKFRTLMWTSENHMSVVKTENQSTFFFAFVFVRMTAFLKVEEFQLFFE